ncbi:hypothetical protein M2132_002088 [Dysgonomonas sp. PH5-45]|uniref:hypothetical protein n=1 Tax=unclassified Dysgonomonas TaxID=2630389 RepID=UPI0024741817|nr:MULTISPECIES: hypothetical protein [unclassified Dysgonomonas]MDH6355742.1 hypothetical protein [Dysgonomonas sp. PH5-45]MDH6388639.1 hypothetical protein [Dysgonomonas sp. PH5-37]
MKTNITRTFALTAFVLLSVSTKAQSFSLNELTTLAKCDYDAFNTTMVEKGYVQRGSKSWGGAVAQRTYVLGDNIVVGDVRGVGSNTTVLAWRFNDVTDYKNILQELKDAEYEQTNREVRNGNKYESLYFERGTLRIIVTKDLAKEYERSYSISLMYTPLTTQ